MLILVSSPLCDTSFVVHLCDTSDLVHCFDTSFDLVHCFDTSFVVHLVLILVL